MLKDKVVVITGASSGIGTATARRLAAEGCRLMLAARRTDRLEGLAREMGRGVACQATDVTDRGSVDAMAQAALARFGRIDALINNAGVMPISPLAEGRVADWDRTIDVNLRGVLYAINAVLPHMLARGDGQIINLSSAAALKIGALGGVYAATKAAIRALSEALRLETAGKLQVTVIYPGAVVTELADSIPDETLRDRLKGMMADALDPAAVAEAVAYVLGQPREVAVNELVVRPTSAQ